MKALKFYIYIIYIILFIFSIANAENPTFELRTRCYYNSNCNFHCAQPPTPSYGSDYESSKEAYGRAQEARAARKAAAAAIREEKQRQKEAAIQRKEEAIQQKEIQKFNIFKAPIYESYVHDRDEFLRDNTALFERTSAESKKDGITHEGIKDISDGKIKINEINLANDIVKESKETGKKFVFLPYDTLYELEDCDDGYIYSTDNRQYEAAIYDYNKINNDNLINSQSIINTEYIEDSVDRSELVQYKREYTALFAGLDDAFTEAFNLAGEDLTPSIHSLELKEFLLEGSAASTATQFGIRLTPIGDVLNVCELITGRELCSKDGRELDSFDRGLAAAGIILRGGPLWRKPLSKIGGTIISTSVNIGEKIIESAEKLGGKTKDKIGNFIQSFKGNSKALVKIDEIVTDINKSPSAIKIVEETPVGRPSFYVNSEGRAVPATGYRHFGDETLEFVKTKIISTGKIPEHPGYGNYITFDRFEAATEASSKLQVAHSARYRVTIDMKDNIEKVKIPNGNGGKASWLEPIVKDIPEHGAGGATQIIIKEEVHGVIEIKDLLNNEILFKK